MSVDAEEQAEVLDERTIRLVAKIEELERALKEQLAANEQLLKANDEIRHEYDEAQRQHRKEFNELEQRAIKLQDELVRIKSRIENIHNTLYFVKDDGEMYLYLFKQSAEQMLGSRAFDSGHRVSDFCDEIEDISWGTDTLMDMVAFRHYLLTGDRIL